MALAAPGNAPAIFDLKSATLPLLAVVLKSSDLQALEQALEARLADSPGLFDQDPVVIDLGSVQDAEPALDVDALLALLRRFKMAPMAVRGGSAEQTAAARERGLVDAPDAGAAPPAPAPAETVVQQVVKEVEVFREVPVPAAVNGTVIVDRPLRSGQQVYARGADVVVLAAVSFGAEVIADGNVHVYAPLRGKAIAGARGNTDARIFTTCLEPELVSIAGIYRTTETALPPEVAGKAAQIRLVGEKLVMEALKP
ncbi:septum site-determining protein MinC [Caldimonas brevitalea]|uniref:Probable septum site-determining protein MinC n=1 Tax=Caldimonas brevitalea TaxID=413882 RepID=A0A0G3BXN1_9BURK|nr:septum site-determining protein MinC [Caldimonas brevitalea]AKJ32146.1 septum site-determining protein MinC [Caldimonas brevitalea]